MMCITTTCKIGLWMLFVHFDTDSLVRPLFNFILSLLCAAPPTLLRSPPTLKIADNPVLTYLTFLITPLMT